jgi:hypothetical protein
VEKQINMYRHETKYFINKIQAAELRLFLKSNMHPDPNGDDTGTYWVRSIYFDTMDNKDYYEKIIGHNIRKKMRLRIYKIPTATVKLELKHKNNSYIHKEIVTISSEDAIKLIHGDCNSLLSYNENATNKAYAYMHRNFYRPIVITDYEREAYLYPFQNIRVTIDKNLRSAFGSQDLFKENICMLPVFNSNVYILEVKYDYMIPDFLQRALSNFTTEKSQISKYCLGRNTLERKGAV